MYSFTLPDGNKCQQWVQLAEQLSWKLLGFCPRETPSRRRNAVPRKGLVVSCRIPCCAIHWYWSGIFNQIRIDPDCWLGSHRNTFLEHHPTNQTDLECESVQLKPYRSACQLNDTDQPSSRNSTLCSWFLRVTIQHYSLWSFWIMNWRLFLTNPVCQLGSNYPWTKRHEPLTNHCGLPVTGV